MEKKSRFRCPSFRLSIGLLAVSFFFATGCSNAIGDSIATIRTAESSFRDGYLSSMVSIQGVSDGSYTQYQFLNSGFVHNITGFSIGKHEVTFELWRAVYLWANQHGYSFSHSGSEGASGSSGSESTESGKLRPVTAISWRDAIAWCNAYSEYSGFKPCYYSDGDNNDPIRIVDANDYLGICDYPNIDRSANGFRLPTEGEWQYAASCGGLYPYNYPSGADADPSTTASASDIDGDGDIQYLGDVAWIQANSSNTTHPVGLKAANAWGLYDMSGNVSELCEDWSNPLPSFQQTDYACDYNYSTDPSSVPCRVTRGGDYASADSNTVSSRGGIPPNIPLSEVGFRVVRRP